MDQIGKNLLQKSKYLKIYSKTLLHDNNRPFKFKSDSFNYIYSSSAYWVKILKCIFTTF